jgi:chaperonin GroES
MKPRTTPLPVPAPEASQKHVTMNLRPLHDRMIVKPLEEDRTSPGGIVIPDAAAEKPVQGRVVAVGRGRILKTGQVRPCDVKVGDRILFARHGGTEIRIDGRDLLVMRDEDVMAIIDSNQLTLRTRP